MACISTTDADASLGYRFDHRDLQAPFSLTGRAVLYPHARASIPRRMVRISDILCRTLCSSLLSLNFYNAR